MDTRTFPRWIILPLLLALAALACNTLNPPPATEPNTLPETQTESAPLPTETLAPMQEATDTVQAPAATQSDGVPTATSQPAGPTCTVLSQTLNLRAGPSQLYRPEIRALPANTEVTPLGYLPKGLIQGRWAYVQDRASQDKGWVSAESNFLSCDIDLTTLPAVDYGPPPAYTPVSDASPGPGTCGEGGVTSDNQVDVYDCKVVFSSGFPVEFIIYKNGKEAGKEDGVQNVVFSVVDKNGKTIYNKKEGDKAYCVFGGNAPCPIWTLDNYLNRWGEGGALLESGTYTLSINPALDDPSVNLFWTADIKVALPF